MNVINVHDVAARRLCVGCGACSALCPASCVKLIDVENDGIRPFVDPAGCQECGTCLKVCPGIHTPQVQIASYQNHYADTFRLWGPFIEIWEGYASDPQILFSGSSGGLCTALSLFCLESGIAGGVIHTGVALEQPWKNQTVRSTSRRDILK